MKTKLFILLLFVISQAVFATDYVVGPGDSFGVRSLYDYDTFLMTGGQGEDLSLGGWSTGTINDTDPIIGEMDGGIWQIDTAAYSELTINGGEFHKIVVGQESKLELHGGQIFGSLTVNHSTAWVHIYGYGFNNDPFTGSPLTGYWADNTPFSINLVDDGISTYDQIVFHIIPEPATLLMLGLGGILVRNKNRG